MDNLKYLRKIIEPEIERYNKKQKRMEEVSGFVFMGGKDTSTKFREGEMLGCGSAPSLKELFDHLYSDLDVDVKFHSAIIGNNYITLVGYRIYDKESNDYIDPAININDYEILSETSAAKIRQSGDEQLDEDDIHENVEVIMPKKKLKDFEESILRYFIKCNITKEEYEEYQKDLEEYLSNGINLE